MPCQIYNVLGSLVCEVRNIKMMLMLTLLNDDLHNSLVMCVDSNVRHMFMLNLLQFFFEFCFFLCHVACHLAKSQKLLSGTQVDKSGK